MFSAPILGGSFNFPFQTFGLEMRTAFWRFHSWTRSVVAPRSDALTLQGNAARSSTQRCLCASLIQMKISFASLYALCEVSLFFLSEWSLDSSPSKSWRSVFDKARIIVDDNLNMNRDAEDCSLSLLWRTGCLQSKKVVLTNLPSPEKSFDSMSWDILSNSHNDVIP